LKPDTPAASPCRKETAKRRELKREWESERGLACVHHSLCAVLIDNVLLGVLVIFVVVVDADHVVRGCGADGRSPKGQEQVGEAEEVDEGALYVGRREQGRKSGLHGVRKPVSQQGAQYQR
jgi:hypothetical protein